MSLWADIQSQASGEVIKKEDSIPILITHMNKYISLEYYEIDYKGRIDAYSANPFYPKGLVEFYKVRRRVIINGIHLHPGDSIVGCEDSHYEYDYYIFKRKQI